MSLKDYAAAYGSDKTRQLTTFASQVYSWMTTGLGLTAGVAYLTFQMGWYMTLLPYTTLIILAAFGLAMWINMGISKMAYSTAVAVFLGYSLLQGLTFGAVLPIYAMRFGGDIIWLAFASSAGLFAAATIYGRTTQSDLTGVKNLLSFGLMALVGMSILFLILSFFMNVTFFHLMIAYVGVVIFVGLIIVDSQEIRQMSQSVSMRNESSYKLSVIMALRMYINVIMVFWYLLRILSSSRR